MTIKKLFSVFILIIASFHLYGQQVGHTQITFIDSSRNNRSIPTEIYYPATVAGNNTPIAPGVFPVISFGHGFVMTWSAYQNFWDDLVPEGYILAFPTTEGGFSPVHADFGADLKFLVNEIQINGAGASVPASSAGNTSAIMGHSMGGGIALRYAMKKNAPLVDGYLLFAPLLGHNAPTFQKSSSTTDTTTEPFLKIHIERIIGLSMYNSIGVHKYDSLPVLFFNLPKEMPLNKYTYRSNISMAPEDYVTGLKAVKVPLLIIVGSNDEAFVASEFKPAVQKNSKGKVIVIEGETHDGICHNKRGMEEVKTWFQKYYN